MDNTRKILKKEIIEEIRGIKYGGMYGGNSFYDFRENFYDKIKSPDEKNVTFDILMELLKDRSLGADFIIRVAWICADLGISGTEEEIKKMSREPWIMSNPIRQCNQCNFNTI